MALVFDGGADNMQVVNYTSLQVTQDGHHVRLSSAGQGVTLRIPTSRLASKITKNQWHDLPLPASKRRDTQDSEKAPLLPSTAPRIKAYYTHVRPPYPSYTKLTLAQTRSNTKLLLLPVPDLDAHLSSIPDETSLGDLFLPGTHQSLALRGCTSLSPHKRTGSALTSVQGPYQSAKVRNAASPSN